MNSPAVNSMSVRSCHLFMATNHVSPLRRQLRSMTSFEVSLSSALSTDCKRSKENLPDGKRKDVIMTFNDLNQHMPFAISRVSSFTKILSRA